VLKPSTRPRRLRRGDRIAVVAPSGGAEQARLDRGVELFRELGLEVVVGEHVVKGEDYFAGDERARAADLGAAWCDPAVAAVVCARGGWGAARTVEHLDWEAMARRNAAVGPPVFLGCSDITTLHTAIANRLGVATLFGPMAAASLLADEVPEPATLRHLARTLAEPETVARLGGFGVRALCPGTARGVTTGGTLTILAASLATPDAFAAPGGVLLLEDVNEEPYRMDRAITQLLRSGALDGLAAVVCGDWTACGPADAVDALLVERFAPLGIPVLAGLAVGHGPVQTTFPLGVEVVVDAAAGLVELLEPALV
jgi:muramoyltetrapeptide carboxypeptidase LdcA involved in peptidoglycan recycling